MFVQLLKRVIAPPGSSSPTCFYDVEGLVGEEVASCVECAAAAKILVCVLDETFPTKYCLREIEAAIANNRPIITVFDGNRFLWKDVGKPAWWSKKVNGIHIPMEVIQKVFERGTICFNTHPDYQPAAEKRFVEVVNRLLARGSVALEVCNARGGEYGAVAVSKLGLLPWEFVLFRSGFLLCVEFSMRAVRLLNPSFWQIRWSPL